MLKQVDFENWKSFRHAKLEVDALTVLIGANASGKSNALDGFLFLQRIALGKDVQAALAGDQTTLPLRGGVEWATLKPGDQFTLRALVQGEDERTDYAYSLTVRTSPHVQLTAESLAEIKYQTKSGRRTTSKTNLMSAELPALDSPGLIAHLYNNGRAQTRTEVRRDTAALSQLSGLPLRKEIADGLNAVSHVLQNIFILDPVPANMRAYSPLSDTLQTDAGNIAGVLAALPPERKGAVESALVSYAGRLPEREIRRVWAEPVGRFQADAMLYCEEDVAPGGPLITVDARGMSDGTLRFLAILTALLTRPTDSQIIVEEVDGGLHPSRAALLLTLLREIGAERHIDVLVTTHNPALLDELGPDLIPFVVVAHRELKAGNSALTLLEDLQNLPKLLAAGPLGQVVTQGAVERSLAAAATDAV